MIQETRVSVPAWLKEELRKAKQGREGRGHARTRSHLEEFHLHTVCEGARCPNQGSCFAQGTATFLILGEYCTRRCRFCAVGRGTPLPLDEGEPERLAQAVQHMRLAHVVITAVTRDDLSDGGAQHYAAVIEALRKLPAPPTVEVLVSDLQGDKQAVARVLAARPDVFAHNVEMVSRLYAQVRPGADYQRSLQVLRQAAQSGISGIQVKTGFMLGLGEEAHEVEELLTDVRDTGTRMLTIGQYLAPTRHHYPVQRYALPAEYIQWEQRARTLGFASVAAGPLVRSSYHAGEYYGQLQAEEPIASKKGLSI